MISEGDWYACVSKEWYQEGETVAGEQYYSVATCNRLSFGSGQRYASKGYYVSRVGKGPDPEFVKVSGWVVH